MWTRAELEQSFKYGKVKYRTYVPNYLQEFVDEKKRLKKSGTINDVTTNNHQ